MPTEEIKVEGKGVGLEGLQKQVEAIAASLNKLANKKYSNTSFTAFTAQTKVLSESITVGFKSLEKQADLTSGAIKELANSLKAVGSAGAGGGRFGEGRLTMGTSLKSIITDMEMMLKLQARWYLARGLLFTAVELPVAAIKSVGSYILEVDKAQAEMMRWGATSGKVTDQLRKDSENLVNQIRKATTEYPLQFAELSKTTQAFVGAGIEQNVVARMLPDIARMQTAFKEIDFSAFAVALTGTFNVFKDTIKGATDQADVFASIIDKLMKAQATGIIRPEQFTTVMQYMSQIGKLSGFTLDQILAMSVALTDTGIRAQSASRLMASMMLTLQSDDKIKMLKGIGIEIDRTIPLAKQLTGVLTALGTKIGSAPVAAGWMGFLEKLVGKEQAKILSTLITQLERVDSLTKAIAESKGGLVAASSIMQAPITAQWTIFTNILNEIGTGVGNDAATTMRELMATVVDMANGALVASDHTGRFADKLDRLGTAGKATKDVFESLLTVLDTLKTIFGGVMAVLSPLLNVFKLLGGAIELLVTFYIGKLLIGAKSFSVFADLIKAGAAGIGLVFSSTLLPAIAGVSGVFATLGKIILSFLGSPLALLTIGIVAITQLFRKLNAEMDKMDKEDAAFNEWLPNAKASDIQARLTENVEGSRDRRRNLMNASGRLKRAEEISAAGGSDYVSHLSATQKEVVDLQKLEDKLNFQAARMRGRLKAIAEETKKDKKEVVVGKTPPPEEDKEYFARLRAAMMKGMRDSNQIAEYHRQEEQVKNKFALDTGLMTQEEYANKELELAKKTVAEKRTLSEFARSTLDVLFKRELAAAEGDNKLKEAINEKYVADKLDLDKIKATTSVEMTKAEYAEKLSSFMEYKNKVEREQSVIAAQSIATAETSADHEKNVLDRQTAVLDDQYNRRVISAKTYYDAIRVITRKGVWEQIDLLEAAFTIWQTQQDEKYDLMTDAEQKAYRAQYRIKIAEKSKLIDAMREGLKTTEAQHDIVESNVPERVFEQAGGMTVKGFAGTFTHYLQQATKDFEDWGKQLEQIADGIAQSIRSSFEDFFFKVMKNDIENLEDLWSALGDMVMRIIANIAAQRATAGISSAINMGIDAGIAAFTKSPVAHSGGVIGTSSFPTRIVPAGIFANAPRYHSGLAGDEFPAILQRGETVLPKGSGGVVVNIKNETGTPVQAKDVKINFDLERMVVGIILKNKAQNGPLRYA